MKNISPRFRTTNLPVARHLSSPLHHPFMSFTMAFLILSMSFLRGQDEKQIFQDLSYRHTSSETGVFPTTSSALAIRGYLFLFYIHLFLKVIMKKNSPEIRTIDLSETNLSSSPLDHQLLTLPTLFFKFR